MTPAASCASSTTAPSRCWPTPYNGKPLNSPNDVVVKSDGSIWFTDPTFGILGYYEGHKEESQNKPAVYRLDPTTGKLAMMADDIPGPNGLAFSPDEKKLYVVASRAEPHRTILSYDVSADGTSLGKGSVLIDAGPGGSPDGFRVDVDGNLWCGWGMGSDDLDGVRVFNSSGKPIGHIDLPERCANVCFGGRYRNRLFMAASHSLYALYVNTQGALGGLSIMSGVESSYAWWRLAASVTLSTVGGIGMWCLVVALPSIQQDLGITRADISFAYTMNTLGFFAGGVTWGKHGRPARHRPHRDPERHGPGHRLRDRAARALAAAVRHRPGADRLQRGRDLRAAGRRHLALVRQTPRHRRRHRRLRQLSRRRDLAVDHPDHDRRPWLAGDLLGRRRALLRGDDPAGADPAPQATAAARTGPRARPPAARIHSPRSLGLSPNGLQAVMIVAGIGCCVAMSMPQVHIVAYCADLGYGVARGAEMLSLMLGFGIVSRIASGWIADRVGGIKTLLLGSTLQCVALVFYLVDDSINSLYLASALFGLFQGGIVPSYAIIVREYFPPKEAGFRVGLAISSTLIGMALGGWMGGVLFDMTGSYRAAFINGIAWNLLNGAIAWWLLFRQNRRNVFAAN